MPQPPRLAPASLNPALAVTVGPPSLLPNRQRRHLLLDGGGDESVYHPNTHSVLLRMVTVQVPCWGTLEIGKATW